MALVPRPQLLAVVAVPFVLSLVALGQAALLPYVLWCDLGVAALLVVDGLISWRVPVEVSRSARDVLSVGQPNAVVLRLRSTARRALDVLVTDDLFEHAQASELPLSARLQPAVATETRYHVVPQRRGAYVLGAHHLRCRSVFGFWWRQRRLSASQPVRVYPDLKSIRTLELLAKQDREFVLVRATRRQGGESEFSRLREYTRDDEYRSVDWRATARRRTLIAREYQMESNQNVLFVLDAGRHMTSRSTEATLFDQALNASLMLGHVAARTGDRVGLCGFDDRVRRFVHPASGQRATQKLIQAAYDLHPRMVESDYEGAFHEISARVKKRCLVIVFSQVLDEAVAEIMLRHTRALLRRHLPLLVLFRDLELEGLASGSAAKGADLYVRGAAAEVLRWRQAFIKDLKAAGSQVLDIKPGQLTTALINRYLDVKARHLL